MCGIGGVLFYNNKKSTKQIEYVKELISQIAVQNQERGRHATGIASFSGYGGYDVFKHCIEAEKMVQTDKWKEFLEENIVDGTSIVLVHTRYATQGSYYKNINNHPIITQGVIGVHNGMVYNDYELTKEEQLPRQAEVDSEVIFQLLDKYGVNSAEAAKDVVSKLAGSFAVAAVRKDEPGKMLYFRNNNPTAFAYIPELNIIVFASLKRYIENAIAKTNELLKIFQVEPESIVWFEPEENIIMEFDTGINNPLEQLGQKPIEFEENNDFNYSRYYYSSGWYGGWYDDYDYGYGNRLFDDEEYSPVDEIYDYIGMLNLNIDEYNRLVELIEQVRNHEWSEGFREGRASVDKQAKHSRAN